MINEQEKRKKATFHLWIMTFSNFISSFGSQIYSFAVSFSILQWTGSASSFAMNLLCGVMPRLISAPFAGAIVDRFSRKKIVILSHICSLLTILILLFFISYTENTLPFLYVGTALFSLTATFSDIGYNASITSLIDQERIQRAVSLNSSVDSIAAIASPIIGGLLYSLITIPSFLIIYMVTTALVVYLQFSMNFTLYQSEHSTKSKEPLWNNMKAGISYVKKKPVIIAIIFLSMVANFLGGAFGIGYSFVLINDLRLSSQVFGIIEGCFAVGMLLTSIYLSMRSAIKFPLAVTRNGASLMGAILIIYALPVLLSLSTVSLFLYYFVLMLVLGSIQIFVNTPINVMLQTEVEEEYKGRVFSLIRSGVQTLVPIGTILFGVLFDLFPTYWILGISGLFLIATSLYFSRPSIMRLAHPERKRNRLYSSTVEKEV